MSAPAVAMTGIAKRFGEFTALDHVDLRAEPGEIHAVVGENGAGKTTLMRILQGAISADEGRVEFPGAIGRPTVGMVSQHYSVIPELSCLENLVIAAPPGVWIDYSSARRRADELAKRMNFEFQWHRPAAELSPAGMQKLEILKLLWQQAEVMILDEPTAMLSPQDSDLVFQSLRQLAHEGKTILLVTHRLPEVFGYCAKVTVLRGGKLIVSKSVADSNARELAELIVGHSVAETTIDPVATGSTLLETRALDVIGDKGALSVKGATFALRSGELVGLAGVDGNGQRELFHALMGISHAAGGELLLDGEPGTQRSTRLRLAWGLRLIAEDRHEEAVVEEWSLVENAALGFQTMAPLASSGNLDRNAARGAAERIAARFSTKSSGLDAEIGSLSGGNQQRFVAGKAFEHGSKVILAFQPARGLDLDATAAVYAALRAHCRAGGSALVVSFDLDELLAQCDRILVINQGVIASPPDDKSRDRQEIGRLMVGA